MKSADQNDNALRRRGRTILRLVLLAPGCAYIVYMHWFYLWGFGLYGWPKDLYLSCLHLPFGWINLSLLWSSIENIVTNIFYAWFVISLPFLFIHAVGWGLGALRRRVVRATAYSNAESNRSPVSIFREACEANGPVLTFAAAIMSLMMAVLLCRTILQLILTGDGGYPLYFGLAPDPSFTWEWIHHSRIGNLLADLLFGLWLIGLPWWLLPRMSKLGRKGCQEPFC